MENILEVIRRIQKKYPECHVGGSIGLLLHGYNVGRDLSKSDIDLISPSTSMITSSYKKESSGSDFDYVLKYENIKIDLAIDKQSYEHLKFNGQFYKVSNIHNIIKYKVKYANEGSEKHNKDLKTLIYKYPQLLTYIIISLFIYKYRTGD